MPPKKAAAAGKAKGKQKHDKQELHTVTLYQNFNPSLYKRVGHDVSLLGRGLAGLVLLFLWVSHKLALLCA